MSQELLGTGWRASLSLYKTTTYLLYPTVSATGDSTNHSFANRQQPPSSFDHPILPVQINQNQNSIEEITIMAVTEFQEVHSPPSKPDPQLRHAHTTHQTEPNIQAKQKVYTLLKQIPPGRVSSYAAMASALQSSPRAVGGALRRNPFAPEVVSPSLSLSQHRRSTVVLDL